jgi:hypothetical protein
MKLSLAVLFLTALAFQNIEAAPQTSVWDSVVADLTELSSTLGSEFLDGVKELRDNAVAAGIDFAEQLRQETEEALRVLDAMGAHIRDNFREYVQKNIDYLRAFIDSFVSTLAQEISETRDEVRRAGLTSVQNALQDLNAKAADLQKVVSDATEQISSQIQRTETDLQEQWNSFAASQLERVAQADEEKVQEAEGILNDFVNRYNQRIEGCASDLEATVNEFETRVNDVTEGAQLVLEGISNKVEDCLTAGNATLADSCGINIQTELDNLSSTPEAIQNLISEAGNLANSNFKTGSCVAETIAEYEAERAQIASQVDQIIQSQSSTTTAAP